jgi:hypothetical protein
MHLSSNNCHRKQNPSKKKKKKVQAVPGNCPDRQTDTVALIYKIAGKNGHFLNSMNVQAKSFHVIGFPASALPKNWEKSPYINPYLPGNYVM